jgi:hypothetical protein
MGEGAGVATGGTGAGAGVAAGGAAVGAAGAGEATTFVVADPAAAV